MDNEVTRGLFREGALALGIDVGREAEDRLFAFAAELLSWNERFNLTGITDPTAVVEKHLLDSLSALPELVGCGSLLDVGTGAGLPGIPLALCRPELTATLVDSVGKKIRFVEHAIAKLGLEGRVRTLHSRVEGKPDREKLGRFDAAIARALTDPEKWFSLALPYLNPGGRAIAMLGKVPPLPDLQRAAKKAGGELLGVRSFSLPISGAERGIAIAHRP